MILYIPKEAVTDTSAVLYWDKVPGADVYRIYRDGELVAERKETDGLLEGLKPAERHLFQVKAFAPDGSCMVWSPEVPMTTEAPEQVISAANAGLIPDRKDPETVRHNTQLLQKAIDGCPAGGTVRVDAGQYVCGALFLHGEMTLRLEEGAVLKASDDPADFPPFEYRYEGILQKNFACLINTRPGVQNRNLRITGSGTIHANGKVLFRKELDSPEANRSNAVCIQNTEGLYLEGITIREAPFWCLHPIFCSHVTMYGIHVITGRDENGADYGQFNGDGIDPDSCSYVAILNSEIESQDDCIAVKAGRYDEGRRVGIPSEHIRISNCQFFRGFGAAMGSESSAGIRDVLVQDCIFTDSFSIGAVKNRRGKSGYIEDIVYDACTLVNRNPKYRESKWFRGAIYIDQTYGTDHPDLVHPVPVDDNTPYIGRITFRNIRVSTPYGKPIYICGLPERHIDGITLENIDAEGKDGCIIINADHVRMSNVSVRLIGEERERQMRTAPGASSIFGTADTLPA